MADEKLDPREVPTIVTRMIHDWVFRVGLDNPLIAEPLEIVRSGLPLDDASEFLRSWWQERLTVDPGIAGPFSDLGFNLMSTILDLVDWKAIIQAMRVRED